MGAYLVYGGSGYIGSAILACLLEREHRIFSTYCQRKQQNRRNPTWIQCDLTDAVSRDRFVDCLRGHVTSLDGVIVSVGSDPDKLKLDRSGRINYAHTDEVSPRILEENFSLMGIGLLHAVQMSLPFLKRGTNPNIVFIGSLMGIKAVYAPLVFATTKASVRGLVESLSKDLGAYDIKVNSVDPGILENGASNMLSAQLKAEYLKHCALRRLGTASEVAEMATWLASDNTFITGKSLLLDGGL